MMNYIVVDVRNGGVDGYYVNKVDADHMCDHWKKSLGHDDVVVAAVEIPVPPIGRCFLSEKTLSKVIAERNARRAEIN